MAPPPVITPAAVPQEIPSRSFGRGAESIVYAPRPIQSNPYPTCRNRPTIQSDPIPASAPLFAPRRGPPRLAGRPSGRSMTDTGQLRWTASIYGTPPTSRLTPQPEPRSRGFVPVPKRWVAEQTSGTSMLHRRPARDYEKLPASSDSPSVLSGHRPDDAPAARGVGLLEATTPTIGWPNRS